MPIARLVVSRLAGEPGPLRIRYAADVFREHASLRGQARQFTQAGVELIGASGPAADAEVVALLVEALAAGGLRDFVVGVGTVAVLRALLSGRGRAADWRAGVMRRATTATSWSSTGSSRDGGWPPVLADALARRAARCAAAARRSTRAAGSCGRAACADALDELGATWRLLEAAGVAERVTLDFGVLRDFDYYTGLVARGVRAGARRAARRRRPLRRRARGVRARPRPPRASPSASSALHIALRRAGRRAAGAGLDACWWAEPTRRSFSPRRAACARAGWRDAIAVPRRGTRARPRSSAADAARRARRRIVRLDR